MAIASTLKLNDFLLFCSRLSLTSLRRQRLASQLQEKVSTSTPGHQLLRQCRVFQLGLLGKVLWICKSNIQLVHGVYPKTVLYPYLKTLFLPNPWGSDLFLPVVCGGCPKPCKQKRIGRFQKSVSTSVLQGSRLTREYELNPKTP